MSVFVLKVNYYDWDIAAIFIGTCLKMEMFLKGRNRPLYRLVTITVILFLCYKTYKCIFGTPPSDAAAQDVVGKIIHRNDKTWTIVNDELCKMKYEFVLAHLRNPPNTPIFVYSELVDPHISKDIIRTGGFKGNIVNLLLDFLNRFPTAVFIDIGANVGAFSIPIAAKGYRVLAVEWTQSNVMRLCASMKRADLTERLTVVYNSMNTQKVSHRREFHEDQNYLIDAIVLDDLLEIYNLEDVVMKTNFDSLEYSISNGANTFFKRAQVRALMVDFTSQQYSQRGQIIFDFLSFHGLSADKPEFVNDNDLLESKTVLFKQ